MSMSAAVIGSKIWRLREVPPSAVKAKRPDTGRVRATAPSRWAQAGWLPPDATGLAAFAVRATHPTAALTPRPPRLLAQKY